jgi:RNA polymerase sigma-54 factor
MALSLQQVQKQTQRLIMTPQMQQSIQLLQMNSMDLEQLIHEEMLENPFLELGDDEEALDSAPSDSLDNEVELIAPTDNEQSGLSEEAKEASSDAAQDNEFEYENASSDSPLEDPSNNAEGSDAFETFKETDVDWKEEFSDSDTVSYSSVREDIEENDFTTYTGAAESLYDSLGRQLHLSVLGGIDFEIGEFIVGNLNEDGYLDCTLANQCLMVGLPAELVAPEIAGSAEKVDVALRRMLAHLHGGENPEAFVGMKRRELVLRVTADIVGLTYDETASLKKDEQLVRLIAVAMKRDVEDLAMMGPSEIVLEVIAFRMNTDPGRVFDVLEIVQEFDPTGIAARSLSECLQLQCEELGIRNRVLYQILENHLNDLQLKRFREIARYLEVPEDKVTEVFHTLSKLDPKPGRVKNIDKPQYITPDVYVKKVDGKYMYFLNEGDAGRLIVASKYRRMMKKKPKRRGVQALKPSDSGRQEGVILFEEKEADYASEKYKNAVWLIRNIEKRKSTVLRVTEAIMNYQKGFLEKGIEFLRPLTLRDIAERVGMHESTIARVTTKKYVETPRGIFELKYFFSSGLETDDGEAASSRSIKELLTRMIEAEEKRKPLSDQKIADMLRQKGFQIARRTVAKYREQLKILPAKLRKEVF